MTITAWQWMRAIQRSDLAATTKLVLFNLSAYMNAEGPNPFPATIRQARDTGLSERSVCTHLDLAEKAGFIHKKVKGRTGRDWKLHEYEIAIPENAGTEPLSVPDTQGTEPLSVRKCEGTEPDDNEALKEVQSNYLYNNQSKDSVFKPAKKSATKKARQGKTPPAYTPEFEEFWKAYPESENNLPFHKPSAFKAWQELQLTDPSALRIISGLEAYKDRIREQKQSPRYVVGAAKFLNERRFESYLEPADQSLPGRDTPIWLTAAQEARKKGDNDGAAFIKEPVSRDDFETANRRGREYLARINPPPITTKLLKTAIGEHQA